MSRLLSRFFPSVRRDCRTPARQRSILRLTTLEQRETPASFLAVGGTAGLDPSVAVFRSNGSLLTRFSAYDPAFRGGVSAATAELDGNPNTVEVVTGAGPGGGPNVRTFSVNAVTGAVTPLASFMAFAPAFRGGVSVAAGDVNNDGVTDIVTGAGPGGGPHVRAFNATTLQETRSFLAFSPAFRGGVSVAAGELNNVLTDGAELAVAAGAGGGPHVRVLGANGAEVASFFAGPASFTGGLRLGQAGQNQLVVAANGGAAVTQFGFSNTGTVTTTALGTGNILGTFTDASGLGTVFTGTNAFGTLTGFTGASVSRNGTIFAPSNLAVGTTGTTFGLGTPTTSTGSIFVPGIGLVGVGATVGTNSAIFGPTGGVVRADGSVGGANGVTVTPNGTILGPNGAVIGTNGVLSGGATVGGGSTGTTGQTVFNPSLGFTSPNFGGLNPGLGFTSPSFAGLNPGLGFTSGTTLGNFSGQTGGLTTSGALGQGNTFGTFGPGFSTAGAFGGTGFQSTLNGGRVF